MKNINWTLIIMQDWEEIFVERTKEQINKAIDEAISIKRNYITIDYLDRDIYFNYIKDKRKKVKYLALEAPKKEFKWFTPEERKNFNKTKEIILEKTKEWRMKKFLIRKENILKQLARDEERFWLETTLNKLKEINNLKLELWKCQILKDNKWVWNKN